MAATCGDASPCRWAAAFKEAEAHSDDQLVDLSPSEQRSRGQELLRLLWEPVTPRANTPPKPCVALGLVGSTSKPPSSDADSCSQTSDTKVLVKNTFIELVPSPSRAIQRTKSDSDIVIPIESQLWHRSHDQHNMNLPSCHDDCLRQKNADLSQESSLRKSQMNHKLSEHTVLNLSACLDHSEHQKYGDALHELSDASTDTPREATDEISMYEVFDTTLLEEIAPEASGSSFSHPVSTNGQTEMFAQPSRNFQQEMWHCPSFDSQFMPARELAFCPNTQFDDDCSSAPRRTMSENPWPSSWQWTSQFGWPCDATSSAVVVHSDFVLSNSIATHSSAAGVTLLSS